MFAVGVGCSLCWLVVFVVVGTAQARRSREETEVEDPGEPDAGKGQGLARQNDGFGANRQGAYPSQ